MTDAKTGRSRAWMYGLLPVMIVAASAGGYLWWSSGSPDRAASIARQVEEQMLANRLQPGTDYYLFVQTVELYPTTHEGKPWDRVGNPAPDIAYELLWQDVSVYTAPVRRNTLIAQWDPITLDLREAILGGKLELSSSLNQGAIVNVDSHTTLEVRMWDQDAVTLGMGLGRQYAGTIPINLAELQVGDNVFTFEQSEEISVKRMVIRATDTNQPVRNLLDALSAP